MKKVLAVLMFCVMMFNFAFVAHAAPINLMVNGEYIKTDSPPVIQNGRTLVPARAIVENLGHYYVEWDPDIQKISVVSIYSDEYVIEMWIGDKEAYVAGVDALGMHDMVPAQMDVPAQIINGRTMVPARFIGEQLNCNVYWDESTKTVIVDNTRNDN